MDESNKQEEYKKGIPKIKTHTAANQPLDILNEIALRHKMIEEQFKSKLIPEKKTEVKQPEKVKLEEIKTEEIKTEEKKEKIVTDSTQINIEPIAEEKTESSSLLFFEDTNSALNPVTGTPIVDTPKIPVSITEIPETQIEAVHEEKKDDFIAEPIVNEAVSESIIDKPVSYEEPETDIKQAVSEIIIGPEETTIEIMAVPEDKTIETANLTYLTDFDLHLFNNGTFYKVFEKFGAHIIILNGVPGVQFTTWAPNAISISVIGEFNGWQEGKNEMSKADGNGMWTVFIPGLKEGDAYKYSIKSNVDNLYRRKSDPFAFYSELRPKNASVVADINKHKWNDEQWIQKRDSNNYIHKSSPLNIYELHLGSWKRDYDNKEFPNEWGYLSYKQLAHDIIKYVKAKGYTHIELMPVMEHPLDISWGYQVSCYYAPTSRFGKPEDFMYFIDYCHQNNIGVILDWVPAHFPSDDFSLAFFDGRQIYGYENIKKGVHKDWGTFIFDYGSPEVQNFLIGSALFWLEKYHADGLRVDAVASMLYLDYSREHGEWEPNILGGRENLEAIEFLKHLNDIVHKYHSNVMMIAEESTAWPAVSHPVAEGGLGFDMKWNMGWMNDILLYFSKDPIHRKFHQGKITFSLWYAFTENFILPISHDEVVHGKKSLIEKMPGDTWQKFANMRLLLGFMFGHPGKKLNFMGSDFAQYNEWNSETGLDWNILENEFNNKLNNYVKDINELYKAHPALYEQDFDHIGFQWIDFSDALQSVLTFCRFSKHEQEILLFTFNMTPTVRENYLIGVPRKGYYKEILNSDAEIYGGSGIGNMGGRHSEPVHHKDWKHSIRVVLPPLGVNVFKWQVKEIKEDMVDVVENTISDPEELYVDTDTGGGG